MANWGPKPPNSGRKKGTPNKSTQNVQEILAQLGCDPIEGMARIAMGDVPCGVCRGKGRTPYKLPDGSHTAKCSANVKALRALCNCEGIGERVCESCYGTLFEPVSPELRGKMYSDLAQYVFPRRKAIEVIGQLGLPDLAAILRQRESR